MSARPRIALITTTYRKYSHSDVLVSRWLEPFATDYKFDWPVGGGDKPRTEIASMYILQFPENDVGRAIAAKHNVPIYSSIRDALTLGGDELAVDGVLLIAEHGTFPFNQWWQRMYPRREMFDEIVEVFKESKRSVPIYNDKHLSYDADSAIHMYNTAREMGFSLMGGSSLTPLGISDHWRMPHNVKIEEGMALFYDGHETYGYHAIEFFQSQIAQRAGGESGIENITVYHSDSFLQAEKEGVWSAELMRAAMAQAQHESGDYHDNIELHHKQPDYFGDKLPAAYCFQHRDGMRSTYLLLNGHVHNIAIAARDVNDAIYSGCDAFSEMPPGNIFPHFARQAVEIEEFMLTGKPRYPTEHYLLCTLAMDIVMHALQRPGETIETPELEIQYQI